MSSTFNRIDTGTLGENSYKERDNQPDVTGKLDAMSAEVIAAIASGKPVRLAGWWKEGRDGKFLSLKVSVMRERAEQPSVSGETTQKQWPAKSPHAGTMEGNLARHALTEDPNDDIPFAFAIAVPALALILAAVHHTGALIA
jgi:hypothetical protein